MSEPPEPRPPRRILAVVNPAAGSCDAGAVRQALAGLCEETGWELDYHETGPDDDVPVLVKRAIEAGVSRVLAAGGDGTAAAVATGIVAGGAPIPLAILPVGTANLLARELEIPFGLVDASRLAVVGEGLRRVDAMRVGDRTFLSHLSVGTYSEIAEETSAEAKRRFRRIAYLWNALPRMFARRSFRFELHVDGTPARLRASFILIANVGELGAGTLRWGSEIRPDDGTVDVCIVRARSVREYLVFARDVVLRRHRETSQATYLRASRRVIVNSRRRVPVRGDGEVLGRGPLDIEIRPGAVSIVVPAPENGS